MPDNVSQGAVSGRVDLSNAPAADLDWDQLFPNPEVQPASQPQAATGTNPQQQPQAQPDQWFLRSDDGNIVYRTAEDAIKGVSHKDSEIARLRSYLTEQGVDPNTLQRSQAQSQTQPQTQNQNPYKYYNNPNLFDEIAEAASKRDRVKYTELFSNAIREGIQAEIAPWRPTLAETNRFKAVRQVKQDIPNFEEFYYGDGHKKLLDTNPLFKDMENIGENDPTAAARLQEVYRAEYLMWQGMQRTNQPQAQPATATPNNPTVRQQTTMSSSTLTPPAPVSNTTGWQEPNWRGAKSLGNEARKQLIQDGDNRYKGMRFEDVGL